MGANRRKPIMGSFLPSGGERPIWIIPLIRSGVEFGNRPYWHYPITNALVEGKHNRVKVLKRRAYGYRNDNSFLLRILSLIHTD